MRRITKKLTILISLSSLAAPALWSQGLYTNKTKSADTEDNLGPYNRTLASESDYDNGITPELGLSRGQIVLSADYERRLTKNFGFGGYFYFTPEKKSEAYPKIISVGGDFKAHISIESLDLFIRPGIGIGFASLGSEDSTYLAPLLGIGALYRVSQNVAVGFEHVQVFNWTADNTWLGGNRESFLVSSQIRF